MARNTICECGVAAGSRLDALKSAPRSAIDESHRRFSATIAADVALYDQSLRQARTPEITARRLLCQACSHLRPRLNANRRMSVANIATRTMVRSCVAAPDIEVTARSKSLQVCLGYSGVCDSSPGHTSSLVTEDTRAAGTTHRPPATGAIRCPMNASWVTLESPAGNSRRKRGCRQATANHHWKTSTGGGT